MVMGKLGPQQAFLMRKLKIQGSMGLAMKLQPILVRGGAGEGAEVRHRRLLTLHAALLVVTPDPRCCCCRMRRLPRPSSERERRQHNS